MPLFRRFRGELWLPALLIAIGAAGLVLSAPSEATLTGRASAVDGDTLRLGGQRVRLIGIDAPELAQSCSDAAGVNWPCGQTAREKMAALLAGGPASCTPRGRDRYGRILATCTTEGVDVGEAIVGAGLAISTGSYLDAEAIARGGRIGIWAGPFTAPAKWRHEQESDTPPANWVQIIASWLR